MAQSKIATAYVQVMPSMEGVASKVGSYFGSAGKSSGSLFGGSLVSTVKSAMAAAGLGKALKEALTEGADLQQSEGGIDTLFKDSADAVAASAQQAYKTAGMSANAYMETVTSFSASLLQGLSGDTEKAASVADMALTDMSDNANKMGTDMASIQNAYQGFAKQNYTMLDNLKLGYGGTKTEMQRLLADAQKLTGVKYDINNLADVYSAIHAIQEEMGITGTTALEASATLTGSFNSMKAAFSNVLGNLTLGKDITPSLEALAETTTTFLVDNLVPAVTNIITALPGAISTFLEEIIPENVGGVVANAMAWFSTFVTENLPVILESGGTILFSLIEGITAAIPSLFTTAANAADALKEYLTNEENLDKLFSAAGTLFGELLLGFTDALPKLLDTALDIIADLLKYLTDEENLQKLWEGAKNIGGKIADNIWNGLINIWSSLTENFPGLISGLNNFAAGGSDALIGATSPALPSHATGLDYVPYDGYIAELHKGEMILTSRQANALRSGAVTRQAPTIIQNIYSEAKTAADLMQEARYQQEMAVLFNV